VATAAKERLKVLAAVLRFVILGSLPFQQFLQVRVSTQIKRQVPRKLFLKIIQIVAYPAGRALIRSAARNNIRKSVNSRSGVKHKVLCKVGHGRIDLAPSSILQLGSA
jgi:hypothetical protein